MSSPNQLSLFEPTPERRTPDADASPAPASLDALFLRVFRRLDLHWPEPQFAVSFYPYAGLRSTIAMPQDDRAEVSVSDVLEGAPALVFEALAEILISRFFGERPSREARDYYKAFVMRPEIWRRIDQARRERGFKKLLPAQGRCFNLRKIFDQLNRQYFSDRLTISEIGWSRAASRINLGHYDSAHHSITISRILDAPTVPRYLIAYVVFHEMLHIEHPIERNGHRRVVHSQAFLEAERAFPEYERARWQMRRMAGEPML